MLKMTGIQDTEYTCTYLGSERDWLSTQSKLKTAGFTGFYLLSLLGRPGDETGFNTNLKIKFL